MVNLLLSSLPYALFTNKSRAAIFIRSILKMHWILDIGGLDQTHVGNNCQDEVVMRRIHTEALCVQFS